MATLSKAIKVYGSSFSGPIRERHDTTYFECEIPEALEKELIKIIYKKIDDFHKKCQCEDCVHDRNEAKTLKNKK